MLNCQSHLFDLPENIHYINCAYMSPQLKSVTAVGVNSVARKSHPHLIGGEDFFQPVAYIKSLFARIIHANEVDRIALIPSVSYGIANAATNITVKAGQEILIVAEQFPSNYFSWKTLADENNASIRIISPPDSPNRGAAWNMAILEAISSKTVVVSMPHVHWADGTLFDLEVLRKRTRAVGAYLIIDGTQSVGALPFDISTFQPDALICGGYKWLLGPYSLGVAYYGERFDHGKPIEENWINKLDSDNFQRLSDFEERYRPMANRYNVGEQSNFILVPMLAKALEQLLVWDVSNIQDYCKAIVEDAIPALQALGCQVEEAARRSNHLFGICLPNTIDSKLLKQALNSNHVYVSQRGDSIRVAPYLYNQKHNLEALVHCFKLASK